MVDFHKFFDGENITQEDLVAWINVGMHHLPQAEDSPNTRTNLAASRSVIVRVRHTCRDSQQHYASASSSRRSTTSTKTSQWNQSTRSYFPLQRSLDSLGRLTTMASDLRTVSPMRSRHSSIQGCRRTGWTESRLHLLQRRRCARARNCTTVSSWSSDHDLPTAGGEVMYVYWECRIDLVQELKLCHSCLCHGRTSSLRSQCLAELEKATRRPFERSLGRPQAGRTIRLPISGYSASAGGSGNATSNELNVELRYT